MVYICDWKFITYPTQNSEKPFKLTIPAITFERISSFASLLYHHDLDFLPYAPRFEDSEVYSGREVSHVNGNIHETGL